MTIFLVYRVTTGILGVLGDSGVCGLGELKEEPYKLPKTALPPKLPKTLGIRAIWMLSLKKVTQISHIPQTLPNWSKPKKSGGYGRFTSSSFNPQNTNIALIAQIPQPS